MKAYRIQCEQHTTAGMLWARETIDVRARTASEALRRAMSAARRNGFLRSRPVVVTSLEELSKCLL